MFQEQIKPGLSSNSDRGLFCLSQRMQIEFGEFLHDSGGCRVEAESPAAHRCFPLTASHHSFTVDGFLRGLRYTLYDTDILGVIPFSGSPVSLFKSSNERLGKKKQVHDFCVRGNNSTRGCRWCHATALDHYILCQPYFIL